MRKVFSWLSEPLLVVIELATAIFMAAAALLLLYRFGAALWALARMVV